MVVPEHSGDKEEAKNWDQPLIIAEPEIQVMCFFFDGNADSMDCESMCLIHR